MQITHTLAIISIAFLHATPKSEPFCHILIIIISFIRTCIKNTYIPISKKRRENNYFLKKVKIIFTTIGEGTI